jgi:hypothetical protein
MLVSPVIVDEVIGISLPLMEGGAMAIVNINIEVVGVESLIRIALVCLPLRTLLPVSVAAVTPETISPP